MLPKINRLPGHLISKALNSKITLDSPFFAIKALKEKSSYPPLVGFIVSTKISKKAVGRNKIKRLLRESIRPYLKTLKKGQIVLIIAKHSIKGKTLSQLETALAPLIKKLDQPQNEKPIS